MCPPKPKICSLFINQCPCVPALRSTGFPEGDPQLNRNSLHAWHNSLSQGLWVLLPLFHLAR